ncbi:Nuclease S1 [Purpureocillium lavendulum]|uniref:Nuclease S1 n=1 Tax=Purpureocillium lavendulum TaxID=1247861 RepID=A0AB34FGB6_9HYPO|nr:Nuclease S1 [Purpureocillium lavendulum]
METTAAFPVRFSCPKVNETPSAQQFPWEHGVPVNTFWNDFEWTQAGGFLHHFSDEERAELPIDPNSTASLNDKLKLLLSLLDSKFAKEEAAVAPASLVQAKPDIWRSLTSSRIHMQMELGLVSDVDALQSVRKLDEFWAPGVNYQQFLAYLLIRGGDCVEAEGIIGPAIEELDTILTRASPQAIGYRRTKLEAIWKQGSSRRADAESMIVEIKSSIQAMVGTRFEVYFEEETETLDKLLAKLSEWTGESK